MQTYKSFLLVFIFVALPQLHAWAQDDSESANNSSPQVADVEPLLHLYSQMISLPEEPKTLLELLKASRIENIQVTDLRLRLSEPPSTPHRDDLIGDIYDDDPVEGRTEWLHLSERPRDCSFIRGAFIDLLDVFSEIQKASEQVLKSLDQLNQADCSINACPEIQTKIDRQQEWLQFLIQQADEVFPSDLTEENVILRVSWGHHSLVGPKELQLALVKTMRNYMNLDEANWKISSVSWEDHLSRHNQVEPISRYYRAWPGLKALLEAKAGDPVSLPGLEGHALLSYLDLTRKELDYGSRAGAHGELQLIRQMTPIQACLFDNSFSLLIQEKDGDGWSSVEQFYWIDKR